MRKTPKLFLLVIGSILLASFAITSCNNDSEKKETTKDTVVTPKMDSMPVVPDTTKMDKANPRPTPQPN